MRLPASSVPRAVRAVDALLTDIVKVPEVVIVDGEKEKPVAPPDMPIEVTLPAFVEVRPTVTKFVPLRFVVVIDRPADAVKAN